MDKNDGKKKFGEGRKGFDASKKLSRNIKKTSTDAEDIDVPEQQEDMAKTEPKLKTRKEEETPKKEKTKVKPEAKEEAHSESPSKKEGNTTKPSRFMASKPIQKDIRKSASASSDEPNDAIFSEQPFKKKQSSLKGKKPPLAKRIETDANGLIRLNKFISNSGLCSRREADELIKSGVIKVNGEVITEMGVKIKPTDKVQNGEHYLRGEQMVYLLLNKPKDYITSIKDTDGQRTILELVAGACKERIFPVGVLDRNTTGLLLMTNDGQLASKLTHPENQIKKIYQVVTETKVSEEDLKMLTTGVELEEGMVTVDIAAYGSDKQTIGVEYHTGKNRKVRRMFDALGYKIKKMDRLLFAELTKKQVPRGEWRMLTEKEISFLRML